MKNPSLTSHFYAPTRCVLCCMLGNAYETSRINTEYFHNFSNNSRWCCMYMWWGFELFSTFSSLFREFHIIHKCLFFLLLYCLRGGREGRDASTIEKDSRIFQIHFWCVLGVFVASRLSPLLFISFAFLRFSVNSAAFSISLNYLNYVLMKTVDSFSAWFTTNVSNVYTFSKRSVVTAREDMSSVTKNFWNYEQN